MFAATSSFLFFIIRSRKGKVLSLEIRYCWNNNVLTEGTGCNPCTPIPFKSENAYTDQEKFSKEIRRDNHDLIHKRRDGMYGDDGRGGWKKKNLPIPVECLDSNQAHSRQSRNRVTTPVRWCDDDNAMMAKMTTTPYKTMDQNSIHMTCLVKTICLMILFRVRQSSCFPSN